MGGGAFSSWISNSIVAHQSSKSQIVLKTLWEEGWPTRQGQIFCKIGNISDSNPLLIGNRMNEVICKWYEAMRVTEQSGSQTECGYSVPRSKPKCRHCNKCWETLLGLNRTIVLFKEAEMDLVIWGLLQIWILNQYRADNETVEGYCTVWAQGPFSVRVCVRAHIDNASWLPPPLLRSSCPAAACPRRPSSQWPDADSFSCTIWDASAPGVMRHQGQFDAWQLHQRVIN